jgi:uncharacterized protein (TIGR03437 family)
MTRLWQTIQASRVAITAVAVFVLAQTIGAQTPAIQTDWRHIGNSAVDVGLAGVATGPVDRVWYSEDGSVLYLRTRIGKTFSTEDFETWQPATVARVPDAVNSAVDRSPEPRSIVQVREAQRGRFYAAGRFVYKSEDSGLNWSNLTEYHGQSILGEGLLDLAVSPLDADDLAVAGPAGVWRSIDGGLTWTSLNAGLPNLTFNRILSTPSGVRGVKIARAASVLEWPPGERTAWRESTDADLAAELDRNIRLGGLFNAIVSTSAQAGDTIYAGLEDGRIFASTDAGANWKDAFRIVGAGRIERIVIDPLDTRMALAAVGSPAADLPPQTRGIHIERTMNSGVFWDDITANLPDTPAHGVAFERSSGAIYAATDKGVFWTHTDLNGLAPPTQWSNAGAGLPDGVPVVDIRLDPGANQLYAGLLGMGVYSTTAPHRRGSPRVVSAADYSGRPVAPGSVLTVFGSEVRSAAAGGVDASVLASSQLRSEIQIPFDTRGSILMLALDSGTGGTLRFGLPLESVSPAIFIDRDGTPMLLDSDSGALLDSMTPAHAGGRLQILSTGLGRVTPEWPAGIKAPADNPPAVVATVHAFIDHQEVGVTKSVLAPGYVGLYLVEIQLPSIVNYGPTELVLAIDGKESNRVRLYVEP